MTEENQVGAGQPATTPAIATERTLGTLHDTGDQAVEPGDAIAPVESREVASNIPSFASDLHGYLRQNISWAETKAAFLFAAASGFLAYLHNHGVTKVIIPSLMSVPNTLRNTVGTIAVGAFIVAACAAFGTFWPRTGGDAEGIVFWKAIATRFKTGPSFAETVLNRDSRALAAAKLQHCWELAKVCQRKFAWVNVATYATAVGSAAALIYVATWMR